MSVYPAITRQARLNRSRWLAPAAGLAAFGVMAVLFHVAPAAYRLILNILIKLPGVQPFTDWEWIPSAIRCWANGVDVYVNNTCFKSGDNLSWNYPPIWLRLTPLQAAGAFVYPTAVAATILFFLSLAYINGPSGIRPQQTLTFAALSCATVLCIERANIDVLIFLLLVLAVALARRLAALRLVGYLVIVAAGTLKFYPFVALVLVARDRIGIVIAMAVVSLATVGAMGFAFHDELLVMARNLPVTSIWTLQFGAGELPHGLGVMLASALTHWAGMEEDGARAIGDTARRVLAPACIMASLASAMLLLRRAAIGASFDQLDPTRRDLLVVGSAVVVGCFLAGQSVIYRGIFLLLAAPSIVDMTRGSQPMRLVAQAIQAMIVFVLWMPFGESLIFLLTDIPPLRYQGDVYQSAPTPGLQYALWLGGELAWWSIETVLLAVLIAFLLRSETARLLLGSRGRHPTLQTERAPATT